MAIAVKDFKNGISFTGGGNGDAVAFSVLGGRYALGAHATWGGGTLDLKCLMPDGTTFVACATQMTGDGFQLLDLPAGVYQVAIATATGVQGFVLPVPYRAFSG